MQLGVADIGHRCMDARLSWRRARLENGDHRLQRWATRFAAAQFADHHNRIIGQIKQAAHQFLDARRRRARRALARHPQNHRGSSLASS